MRIINLVRAGSLAAIVAALALAAVSASAAVVVPKIASFTPSAAKPGATITIAGANLTGASSVMIDGMKATFKVVSAKKLTVKIPAKAKTGSVTVVTKGGTAKSTKSLTVS